jgi:hypothetical protein
LNFGYWDLFEICLLVLGIFSALTRPPHPTTRNPQPHSRQAKNIRTRFGRVELMRVE